MDFAEEGDEHGRGELPGEGVLLAGVVGAEKARQGLFEAKSGAVGELEGRKGADFAFALEDSEIRKHGDAAEGEDGTRLKNFELALEVGTAVCELGRERLVGGRRAASGSSDVGVFQFEPVVAVSGNGLICEAAAIERGKQEVAGAVSGEDAAGAIASVSGGREAQDEKLGAWIAEAGDRLAPVLGGGEGAALFAGDLLAIGDQARALAAGDDFGVQLHERVQEAEPSGSLLCPGAGDPRLI